MSKTGYMPVSDNDLRTALSEDVIFVDELPSSQWKSSLFGCFEDCETCLLGAFCTPCLYGQNAAAMQVLATGEPAGCMNHCCNYYCSALLPSIFAGSFFALAMSGGAAPVDPQALSTVQNLATNCGIGCFAGANRSEIRSRFNIEGSGTSDFVHHFLCSPCAVCQESREIKHQIALMEEVMVYPGTAPVAPTMVYAEEFKPAN